MTKPPANEELYKKICELETALIDMTNSTSWKVTAPLRGFRRLLSGQAFKRGLPIQYIREKLGRDGVLRSIKSILYTFRYEGWHNAMEHIRNHFSYQGSYTQWIREYDTLSETDRTAIRKHIEQLDHKPLISIVLPVYNVEVALLKEAIDSVTAQLYTYWELCIADDCSTCPELKPVLEEYAKQDKRIHVTFRDRNGHISASSNDALKMATGEFVALLDHDDLLCEQALYHVAIAINTNPEAMLFYSDEDKIDPQGRRFHPYFKSDWNPDLFMGQNMFSHLGVYHKSLLDKIGGFREGYEGSQDYDLCLRSLVHTPREKIVHIPRILYHWRVIPTSTASDINAKPYAIEASRKAKQDYLDETCPGAYLEEIHACGHHRVVWPIPDPAPRVDIIIPTRDGYELVKRCVDSVREKTSYPNYHITIVDNGSEQVEILQYFKELDAAENISVLPYPKPFNFSAINNFAVAHTSGEVLCFLNNDTEIISEQWLTEMASHALRTHVGAVGAKLYYPNHRVQHGGILIGAGKSALPVADHLFKHLDNTNPGYFGRAILAQEVSAVTGACLVIRREIFDRVGGFDEENLAIAFNDVDLCLKLRKEGFYNIWTPFAELFHHESASRGAERTAEKIKRFQRERARLYDRWNTTLTYDPYYNPNLDYKNGTFGLAFPPLINKPWENMPDAQNHQQETAEQTPQKKFA